MVKKGIPIKNKIQTIQMEPIEKRHKYIFQIGFNRCATQSLNNAFETLGLKTIHNSFKSNPICPRQYLAILMYNNLRSEKKEILQYELKDYQCYLDMEYVFENELLNFYDFFEDIEKQNQGSSFIMNIRPVESWICSRIKLGKMKDTPIYYKDITKEKLESWVEHYFNHSLRVRDYFIKNRIVKERSKLYVYSIEEMNITELMREMGIWKEGSMIIEKVDFARSVKLGDDEKNLPKEIEKMIEMKKKENGDPSRLEWWN